MDKKLPKIGTGVIILNNKKQVLFGKRTYNPIGWSVPGGHIEYGETIIDCAKRETLEEAGIEITSPKVMTIGENIFPDKNLHSITMFVFATADENQEPQNMEPDKCDGWQWFDINNIPSELSFNYDPVLKNFDKLISEYFN